MAFVSIPKHDRKDCELLKTDSGCYQCCDRCNYDRHTCPGCGDNLTHLNNDSKTGKLHDCFERNS